MNAKERLERIDRARKDRSLSSERINKFYSLCAPYRQRVASRANSAAPDLEKQSDIYDQTIQQAVMDFAADQIDFFTPDYKPWVKMKAGTELSAGEQRTFSEEIKKYQERLFDLIRQTDFYEQQQEIFIDLAGGAGGINIPLAPAGRPVRCRPILMANLLFDEGPFNDLDGRWNEFFLQKKDILAVFPGLENLDAAQIKTKKESEKIRIIQGNTLMWPEDGKPKWSWELFINDKPMLAKDLGANEPPQIHIARWRHAPPSAWGPGPVDLALSAGFTLDELGYLNLKKLAKEVDPPYSYENDGVFNPQGGVNPGSYLARQRGTKAPEPLFEPSNSQNVYFDREVLQMVVKRAMYQDGPFQRGDTPPTATQWLDEKAMQQRRQLARRRVYREYVLPVLQRFAWIFSARGELPAIKIDGKEVAVEFVSPLSKASDAEEVSSGMQLVQAIVGMFGETGIASIDIQSTIEAWKDKLGDGTVEITSPDQQADLIKNILEQGRNVVSER